MLRKKALKQLRYRLGAEKVLFANANRRSGGCSELPESFKKLAMSKGTAVIIGAANGIGQAYPDRLATDGFDIAVADVSDVAATRVLVEAKGRKFL